MKTYLNNPIHEDTRGIVYICDYNFNSKTIEVIKELQFKELASALNAYAEIPNPESQLAMGATREIFLEDLQKLHDNLNDPKWVEEFAEYL